MKEQAQTVTISEALSQVQGELEARRILDQEQKPYLIQVCGASASGKSTISRLLAGSLPGGKVFSMDAYLAEGLWDQNRVFNHNSPNPNRPYIAGISPEIWDMPLMLRHLKSLRNKDSVQMPVFDETVKDRTGYIAYTPGNYIIVEGIHAFEPEFLDGSQYALLVRAPLHDRITRKMVRTCRVYNQTDVDEVVERYLTKDEPVNRIYEPEHIEIADRVIDNKANPNNEYKKISGQRSILQRGRRVLFTPTEATGSLVTGEELAAVFMPDNSVYLQYKVGRRILVETPLKETTLDMLRAHYIAT